MEHCAGSACFASARVRFEAVILMILRVLANLMGLGVAGGRLRKGGLLLEFQRFGRLQGEICCRRGGGCISGCKSRGLTIDREQPRFGTLRAGEHTQFHLATDFLKTREFGKTKSPPEVRNTGLPCGSRLSTKPPKILPVGCAVRVGGRRETVLGLRAGRLADRRAGYGSGDGKERKI